MAKNSPTFQRRWLFIQALKICKTAEKDSFYYNRNWKIASVQERVYGNTVMHIVNQIYMDLHTVDYSKEKYYHYYYTYNYYWFTAVKKVKSTQKLCWFCRKPICIFLHWFVFYIGTFRKWSLYCFVLMPWNIQLKMGWVTLEKAAQVGAGDIVWLQ